MFKQAVPAVGLTIESGTDSVPADGAYHVLLKGDIIFSSKSKVQALAKYKKLRESLVSPAPQSSVDVHEALRRERASMEVASMLAATSRRKRDKATSKGGRGGRGGVGG